MNHTELLETLKTLTFSINPTDAPKIYYAIKLTETMHKSRSELMHPYECYNDIVENKMGGICYLIESLPLINHENGEVFDRLYRYITGLALSQFLSIINPEIGNKTKLFSVLGELYKGDTFSQCYFLTLLFRMKPDLSEDVSFHQYGLLCGVKTKLDKTVFWKLYRLFNWRAIQNKLEIKAAAKEANRLLTKLIITDDKKCEIVDKILQHLKRLKGKEVKAPAAYLSSILYGDSKVFSATYSAEIIEKIIGQLTNSVTFLDYLKVLMTNESKAESLAELGLLFPMFYRQWEKEAKPPVCLVNTSPDFFRAWELSDDDTVTVPYDSAKEPISKLVNATVYSTAELDLIPYHEKQMIICLACNNAKKSEILDQVQSLCRDNATVFVVLPDTYSDIISAIPNYVINNATILPKDVFHHGKTKFFIAKLVPNNKRCKVISSQTVKIERIDKTYYVAPPSQWPKTRITREEFASNQPLRRLFSDNLTKKPGAQKRTPPKMYTFSPELKLWYNCTPNKEEEGNDVCLYMCEVPSKEQEKRNKYSRGKKIKSTETRKSAIPEDQIEEWIGSDGAFRDHLREKAIEQIEQYYKEDLSLKTLWYCLFDRCSFTEAEEETLKKIVKHDAVANLMIGNVSDAEIKEAVEQSGESYEKISSLLDTLFEVAVRRKYIKVHPFESMHAARRNQKRREDSVRALAKRSYTNAEEDKIWEFYQKNKQDSSALGMLICFFTGLSIPMVCALTWNDFQPIRKTEHKKLVVNKKMLQNSEIEWQTEEKNCRLLPIADCLAIELNKWKEDHKPPNDSLIVSTIGNPLNAVRKQIKAAEKYAGISEDQRSIPEVGFKTDLNKYSGNRMRPNFAFRCYEECSMTDAEVHYLLLKEMPDTLSNNYVDYGHECLQDRIAAKLNQWGQRFLPPIENEQRHYGIRKQKVSLVTQKDQTESYYMDARTSKKITIIVECDHDFDYQLLTIKEGGIKK